MLNIRLFGQLEIKLGDALLQPFPTKKSKNLFAFLATNHGRAFPREVLAGMFWGDQPEQSARKCLRTAIWRARSIVEPSGVASGTYLTDRDHALAFNGAGGARVDIEEFEGRIASVSGADVDPASPFAYRSLQDAVRLYRADFLEGVYDDWALCERRRLKSLLLDTFERLIVCGQRRQDWSGAIMWSERLLACDPLRENAHRNLMRSLCFSGNRPAAVRSFEKLCKLLKCELGVSPMPETISLYQTICSGQLLDDNGTGAEPTGLRPNGKLAFAPPTLSPLVVMQNQAEPAGDLIPSVVFASVSRPTKPN